MTYADYGNYISCTPLASAVRREFEERIAGEIAMSCDPGRTMRKWREEFGLSQHELAEAMGVGSSVVSDYESGRRRSPGASLIKRMVESLTALDEASGSRTIAKYAPEVKTDCVIAMGEFPESVPAAEFVRAMEGSVATSGGLPARGIHGYTVVDSLKAILSLESDDYMKIYGRSTERALIFTNVHYGRSPMVAVRAHPLTPAMVVYQRPENTDPLAVKLAQVEGIPLVTTVLDVGELVARFEALKEGREWTQG